MTSLLKLVLAQLPQKTEAGVLMLLDSSTCAVSSSVFRENQASIAGVCSVDTLSSLSVSQSLFDSNEASDQSNGNGGVFLGKVIAADSVFVNNAAQGSGAVLSGAGEFLNCNFSMNEAIEGDGGVGLLSGASSFEECEFAACVAQHGRGALFYSKASVTITPSSIQEFTDTESNPNSEFILHHEPTTEAFTLFLDRTTFQSNNVPAVFSSTGSVAIRNCPHLKKANDVVVASLVSCDANNLEDYCAEFDYCSDVLEEGTEDSRLGLQCYCKKDGVAVDPAEGSCLDSAQIFFPVTDFVVRLAKDNGRDENSLMSLFTNQGAEPLNWSFVPASIADGMKWSASPMGGLLQPCDIANITIFFDPTEAQARDESYHANFTLNSQSLRDRQIPLTIEAFVDAPLDTNLSSISVVSTSTLVTGGPLGFTVNLIDFTGMPLLDRPDIGFSASLTAAHTKTTTVCAISFDSEHRQHIGTCDIPDEAGTYSLKVRDLELRQLINNTATEVVVSRCQSGEYSITDDTGLVVCMTCNLKITSCLGDGMSISDVTILPGNWRTSSLSEDIRPCPSSDPVVCVGTTSNGLCKVGHIGAYCSVCEDDYFKDTRGVCAGCNSARVEWVGPSVVVGVCLVLGLVSLSQFILTGQVLLCTRLCSCFGERKRRRRPSANLDAATETRQHILQLTSITKMVTNFGQILAGIGPT